MSKRKKRRPDQIAPALRETFMQYMAAHDDDDLPDGAWFATLEEAAGRFFEEHGLRIDRNEGAHMYIKWSAVKAGRSAT